MVESSKGFMMAEVAMRFVFDLDWLRQLMLRGLRCCGEALLQDQGFRPPVDVAWSEVLLGVEKPYFSIKVQR